jgi:transposase-like protein
VREIIELVLEEAVEAALGAPRSQRVAERNGYRHGRKSRRLTLHTGTVRLAVPRARLTGQHGSEREWHSQLVPRYRRSSREVEQSVLGSPVQPKSLPVPGDHGFGLNDDEGRPPTVPQP